MKRTESVSATFPLPPRFTVRPLAWREINAQLDYLEEQAGLETAERFLDQLISSFEDLSRMPRMGVLCGFRKPATRRLRRWPVKGFENWLIFYRAKARRRGNRPSYARSSRHRKPARRVGNAQIDCAPILYHGARGCHVMIGSLQKCNRQR